MRTNLAKGNAAVFPGGGAEGIWGCRAAGRPAADTPGCCGYEPWYHDRCYPWVSSGLTAAARVARPFWTAVI